MSTQGILTSSLQRDQIRNINARARPTQQRICKQRHQRQGAGPGAGAGDCRQGRAGGGEPEPFSTFTQPLQEPKKEEEEEAAAGRGEDFRKVREMLRTLSSAMEKPIWDHCTQEDPCFMPNIKQTPDITIVIFPDD